MSAQWILNVIRGNRPDRLYNLLQIQPAGEPDKESVQVRGNEVVYMKPLSGDDEAVVITNGQIMLQFY
jgi:hypothetical protein